VFIGELGIVLAALQKSAIGKTAINAKLGSKTPDKASLLPIE